MKKIGIAVVALLMLAAIGFGINYMRPIKRLNRHYQTGRIYFQKQKFVDAIREYKKALEIDPSVEDIRYQLALAYQGNRDLENAIKELKYLVKNSPKFSDSYFPLTQLYIAQRKYQDALGVCDSFLKEKADDLDMMIQKAQILVQMRQEAQAEDLFSKATQVDPYDGRSYTRISQLYWGSEREEKALKSLSEYLQENPANFEARLQLGRFYMVKNENAKASEEFLALYRRKLFEVDQKKAQSLDQGKLSPQLTKLFEESKRKIFSTTKVHQETLDKGKISESLRRLFIGNGENVLRTASVDVVDKGKKWEVRTGNDVYSITLDKKNEGHYINVFDKNVFSDDIVVEVQREFDDKKELQIWQLKEWKILDNKKRKTFVAIQGGLVSLDGKHQKVLDNGLLTDEIRKGFLDQGIELSDKAKVKVGEKGKDWTVVDGEYEYPTRLVLNRVIAYNGYPVTFYEKFPSTLPVVAPNLSLAYLLSGRTRSAVAVAEEGLKDVSSRVARNPVLVYINGIGQLARRNYEDAIKEFEWAKKSNLPFPDLFYRLALAYTSTRQNQLAISELREALKRSPKFIEARTLLTELLLNERQLDRAEENCNQVLEDLPETATQEQRTRFLRLKARILAEKGDSDESKAVFDQITQLDPDSIGGKLGKVLVDMGQKRYEEAISSLKRLREEEKVKLAEVNLAKNLEEQAKPDPYLTFLLARNYLAKGDIANALENTNLTLDLAENSVQATILLAEIRLQQRAPGLAAEEYEKIFKALPDNPQVCFALTNLYLRMGKPDDAWSTLERGGHLDSKETSFLEMKARIYFAQKKYRQSLDTLQKVPESEKKAGILALMSDIYNRLGKSKQARDILSGVGELAPNTPIFLPIAISHYLDRNWAEAVAALDKHLSDRPGDVLSRIFQGVVLATGDYQQKALDAVEPIFLEEKNKPVFWLAHLVKSAVYINRDQFSDARKEIDSIPNELDELKSSMVDLLDFCEKENANITSLLGVLILNQLGQSQDALFQCEEAARALGNDSFLLYVKSNILLRLGKVNEAQEILESLAQADNAKVFVYNRLGRLLMQKREYQRAEKYLLKTLEKESELPDVIISLALCYQGQNKIDEAIDEYKKVIKITKEEKNPFKIQAYNNLAWLLLSRPGKHNLKWAIEFAEEAHQAFPNQADIADTLGWAYFKAENYAAAQKILELAHNLSPKQPSILYHLGEVYTKLEKWDQARTVLSRSLELGGQFPEEGDVKRVLELIKSKTGK